MNLFFRFFLFCFLAHINNFFALEISAIRASLVRLHRFLAMRTSDQNFWIDDEADSSAVPSSFGMVLFWYGHIFVSAKNLIYIEFYIFVRFCQGLEIQKPEFYFVIPGLTRDPENLYFQLPLDPRFRGDDMAHKPIISLLTSQMIFDVSRTIHIF